MNPTFTTHSCFRSSPLTLTYTVNRLVEWYEPWACVLDYFILYFRLFQNIILYPLWWFNLCLREQIASRILRFPKLSTSLQWRHNERVGVSNPQPHDCLLNRSFRHRWKKTSRLRVTGLCARNSPVTGEFPAQRTSNAENVSFWLRHHFGSPMYIVDIAVSIRIWQLDFQARHRWNIPALFSHSFIYSTLNKCYIYVAWWYLPTWSACKIMLLSGIHGIHAYDKLL